MPRDDLRSQVDGVRWYHTIDLGPIRRSPSADNESGSITPRRSGTMLRASLSGVRAVIKSGDKIIFQTDAPTPAVTQGRPAEVKLMLTRAAGG